MQGWRYHLHLVGKPSTGAQLALLEMDVILILPLDFLLSAPEFLLQGVNDAG